MNKKIVWVYDCFWRLILRVWCLTHPGINYLWHIWYYSQLAPIIPLQSHSVRLYQRAHINHSFCILWFSPGALLVILYTTALSAIASRNTIEIHLHADDTQRYANLLVNEVANATRDFAPALTTSCSGVCLCASIAELSRACAFHLRRIRQIHSAIDSPSLNTLIGLPCLILKHLDYCNTWITFWSTRIHAPSFN